MAIIDYGQGLLYAPPLVVDKQLHRGVLAIDQPSILEDIQRDHWAVVFFAHSNTAPPRADWVDLWQFDPIYDKEYGDLLHVHALDGDLTDPQLHYPLDIPKQYDVIFVSSWSAVKRHMLFLDALRYAKSMGRPVSVAAMTYHWKAAKYSTSVEAEQQFRSAIASDGLDVTMWPSVWNRTAVNVRYNQCRCSVLCSSTEGGVRAPVEANLAGVPHIQTRDTRGGITARVSLDLKNGLLCDPTPRGIAEAIWYCLDHTEQFSPREWALKHCCKPVAAAEIAAIGNVEPVGTGAADGVTGGRAGQVLGESERHVAGLFLAGGAERRIGLTEEALAGRNRRLGMPDQVDGKALGRAAHRSGSRASARASSPVRG